MKTIISFLCLFSSIFSADYRIDFHDIKSHIDNKFSQAYIDMDPFPHMIIQDILPEKLYLQMQYFWPDSACFAHKKSTARHLYVTKGCAETRPLTPEQKIFWRVFGEAVMEYIKINVKSVFLKTLNWKFPHLSQSQLDNLKRNIRFFDSRQDSLMEHHYGYQIHPHVDQEYLFATLLLYCPEDDAHEYMGTTLLNVDGSIAKVAPYTKNTLLVMPQHPMQLHSNIKHDDPNFIRKLYGAFIHLAPDIMEQYYGNSYTQEWLYYTWEQRHIDTHS